MNAPGLEPASCLQFDHLHFVLQAAVDGLGFALAPVSLIAHDMAAGRLVSPLPELRMALSRHYFGLAPNAAPETQHFVQWLMEELKAVHSEQTSGEQGWRELVEVEAGGMLNPLSNK